MIAQPAAAQPAAQPNGLWRVVWMLLHLRLWILFNGFRRAKTKQKIVYIFVGLMLLPFLGFIFFLSWTLLRFLSSPLLYEFTSDVGKVLESMPMLILSGAFIGILFTSFGVLLQALYLADDMDFLLSTPISIRAVFIAKLLQTILPNFGLICLFALPVLFGLGATAGYSVWYYPAAILLLSALALAAAGLGSLLVMVVVRLFPARRVAEVLGFIGGVSTLLCSQSGQLANWSEISQKQGQQVVGFISRFNTPWSPLTWIGRGLQWIGEGNWPAGLGISILALISCGAIFGAALVISEQLYYSGWSSMTTVAHKKKPSRRARSGITARPATGLIRKIVPAVMVEIIQKDALVLRRDVRSMSQLITPLILGVVYFVMILRGGNNMTNETGNAPVWIGEILKSIAVYSNVGLSLFVGWMLLSRLAGMAFSHEGRQYWILKTAPVSTLELIGSKFLAAFLPVLGLCWGFLLVTWLVRQPELKILLFALPVVALAVAGNAGINLTFGIVGAKMNWEDPRQMQRGTTGCLNALISILYLPVSLGLFFGPVILFAALDLPEIVGHTIGLLVGGVFSLGCAVIPLWLVRKRVERLGEE